MADTLPIPEDDEPMRQTIAFTVHGTAASQGSHRAFVVHPKGGGKPRAVITDQLKATRPWRAQVTDAARQAMDHAWPGPIAGPVLVTLTFHMPRPRSHYRTGKFSHELRPNAPHWMATRPDGDKLDRAVKDALKNAGVYLDDSQIARWVGEKVYISHDHPTPCVEVRVEALERIAIP